MSIKEAWPFTNSHTRHKADGTWTRAGAVYSAIQLHYSARDMLDLFRAIVPVYHANEIESIPTMAMVFVNDCNYIVHHLMTLGYQFHVNAHVIVAARTRTRHRP